MAQTKAQLIDGKGEVDLGALSISGSAPDNSVNLDASGRLLVGTSTSPSAGAGSDSIFVVQGYKNGATGQAIMAMQRGEAATAITSGEEIGNIAFCDSAGNSFAWVQAFADAAAGSGDYPGRLVFSTTADGASSPTERMRITNDGAIWMGTNNIQRYNNTTVALWGYDPGSGVATAGQTVFVCRGNDGAGTYQGVGLARAATSWATYSDERGKTALIPIENGLSKLSTLRAVTGRYLEDEKSTSRSFLIAQDVQAVLPEAVDSTDPEKLSLRYTEVIPLLVAALKESKERIEQLEAKVAALEAQ